MNTTVILVVAGFGLGCATAGAIGFYLALSRHYRKVRNRLAIHFGQAFVAVSAVSGLLLLQRLEQFLSVARHSSAYYDGMYAYTLGFLCVTFVAMRAEFRWRRSCGLVASTESKRPVVPGARRRLLIGLGILAVSSGFSVAYWVFRPKPISVMFCATSMLFVFAFLIFVGRTLDRAQMRESRTVILVLAAAIFCLFGGLAWKLRNTDPTLSSAWLATLSVPSLVVLAALFFMRPNTDTQRNSW
jgi:hypothetical protein